QPTEFATMNGLTMGIAGLGGMIAATPLAVAATTIGWRTTYAGMAVFGILAALAAYVMAHDHPTDAGLDPVENVPSTPELTFREVMANTRRVLGGLDTWLAGLVLFCFTGINITVVGLWVIPYVVQTYDVSVTTASTLQLLPAAGILFGPPVIGRISDYLEQRTSIMVGGAVVFTALFSVLAAPYRQPFIVVGLVLFGASFLAGTSALAYTVVKDNHGAAASGVATGTVNAISFAGAAVFPVLMGAVLDRFWTGQTVAGARVYTATGYRYMFGLAVLAGLFALGCSLLLHWRSPS
ncbi:MAG: MFS transporter, partial [Halolamina sp.]